MLKFKSKKVKLLYKITVNSLTSKKIWLLKDNTNNIKKFLRKGKKKIVDPKSQYNRISWCERVGKYSVPYNSLSALLS